MKLQMLEHKHIDEYAEIGDMQPMTDDIRGYMMSRVIAKGGDLDDIKIIQSCEMYRRVRYKSGREDILMAQRAGQA